MAKILFRKGLWSGILVYFGFVLGLTPQTSTAQDEVLSPRNANYTMDVVLDIEANIITGITILNWRNITDFPTDELQFHLYYNAWRNDKSSFLNNGRNSFRRSDYKDDEWAYNDVRAMKILPEYGFQETEITGTLEFIQLDDGNKHDRTVLRASLPRAVGAGESISLEIKWETRVPRTFSRTGRRGEYYFLAQWFPKIGVLEADGNWNCHQFIQTEFYADYGVYDVKMTVPSGWVLGATGKEMEKTDNGDGTTTHRYTQADVHDFTWVTSPHFTAHVQRFEEPGLPQVDMRLLLMPDHASKKDRYFVATAAALKYYGNWFGAYPYDHVTVVDPAYGSRTGGMEYPTFFTGGTRWLSPLATRSPEGVTVHEAGHQFWYGIVGNNEFEYAWLDEGFNTYSTTRTMSAAYDPPVLSRRYFDGFIPVVYPSVKLSERTDGADQYYGFNSTLKRDPMSTISWKISTAAYGLNSYGKPGMMLRTLENYLGWETFQIAISTYFERWKFKHPKPQDFFDIVNEISGQDMGWFFEQTYNSSSVFDYAVDEVTSNSINELYGYEEQDGELVFQKSKSETDSSDSEKQYHSTVVIRRWGEAVFPIEVKITFDNEEEIMEQWDGLARWHQFDYVKSAKVVKVEVDPENKLVLDVNHANNSWLRNAPAEDAARRWAVKWMIWMQSILEFFAFFS